MLSFKRKAANGCSVNHLCQQTDPIMSANPGNTGGKFKSSSMKHLINILNVFLAIYASRAVGCFGVPLISHWERGAVHKARMVGCDAWWAGRKLEVGEKSARFQTWPLAWGRSPLVFIPPLPTSRPTLWVPPQSFLCHLWLTA